MEQYTQEWLTFNLLKLRDTFWSTDSALWDGLPELIRKIGDAVVRITGVGRDEAARDSLGQMKEFLQGRWKGIRPVLLGRTIREMEMTRALYELSFNVNGGEKE